MRRRVDEPKVCVCDERGPDSSGRIFSSLMDPLCFAASGKSADEREISCLSLMIVLQVRFVRRFCSVSVGEKKHPNPMVVTIEQGFCLCLFRSTFNKVEP